jgi:hypothetical protein
MLAATAGCVTQTARQVKDFSRYKATDEDRREQDKAFAGVDAIGKTHLRIGMAESEVRRIMGEPMIRHETESSRVRIWTYLLSFSGTWTYSVAFLDDKVEYFGELHPQWLGEPVYDNCTDHGIKVIHEVRKQEKRAEPSPAGDVATRAAPEK